jgi:peroxiredoxin
MGALPDLIHLDQKYKKQGLEIIGISLDSDKQALAKVIQEYGIAWPNYWDDKRFGNELAIACGVSATPDCWLLDRNGVVQEMGTTTELERKIDFLISQRP